MSGKSKTPRRIRAVGDYERSRGCSAGLVRAMAERGEIWSTKFGNRPFIDEGEVDHLFREKGLVPGEFEVVPATRRSPRKAA